MPRPKTREKRKPGRPPKVANEIVMEALVGSLELGIPIKTSCVCAGLSVSAYMHAMQLAREAKQDIKESRESEDPYEPSAREKTYLQFAERVTRAREDGTKLLVKMIISHGKDDWRALAFVLERTRPQEFGRQTKLEVSGDPDNPLIPPREELSQEDHVAKYATVLAELMAQAPQADVSETGGNGTNGKTTEVNA